MKMIQLNFEISDDMMLKGVTVGYNDTILKSDSNTIKLLAEALIEAIDTNQDDCEIQDALNNLGIKKSR